MPQNNSTRLIAEQIGLLFIQNIEQAELIKSLQDKILKLTSEDNVKPAKQAEE